MIQRAVTDMRAALMLLTRLPVWTVRDEAAPDLSRSVWAYPLIGALVGAIGAAGFYCGSMFGLPSILSAGSAVGLTILVTGALHEDGLADTADGLGGGATPEQKLEIMRDSRIGTFGALAIVLSLLLRIHALAGFTSIATGAAVMVTLHCLSRGAIVALLATLEPARREGMGAVAGHPSRPVVVLGILLAVAPLLVWPLWMAARMLAATAFGALLVGRLARRHVGGYTGDVLGAAQQVSECSAWIVLATVFH